MLSKMVHTRVLVEPGRFLGCDTFVVGHVRLPRSAKPGEPTKQPYALVLDIEKGVVLRELRLDKCLLQLDVCLLRVNEFLGRLAFEQT
jgi:hypothetical protein